MAFNNARMTSYALISALEEDLRDIIKIHLNDKSPNDFYFNDELVKRAKNRIEQDIGIVFDDLENRDLVDYFDLGDTFQTINTNAEKFPKHLSKLLKKSTAELEKIIPIRNRVMHIRPLNFEDLPTLSNICTALLSEDNSIWKNLLDITNKLREDPSFVFSLDFKSFDDSDFNHNLPLPDFDETGLIGREKVVEQVKQLCLGAYPVISIVGEGGVGKTALALKVAYELLEDDSSPFDAIVWVSSKTTQITVNEIKDIKGAITSSLGVIQEISEQINTTIDAPNLKEINEYLSTFKIALFIDNLETILDDNIREFVGSIPLGSKIIITSRIGLGAFEYPIKLQGIEESYASQFLRTLAKLRNIESIAKLDEKVLRNYVNRMQRNPSYIKWFISSIQTGLSPETILQNSELFLDFCMSNVYEYLSTNAINLTTVFQCSPGFQGMPELAYLTDFNSLQIQKSVQELMATNMLTESTKVEGASVKTTYQLSELARAYLSKHHKPSKKLQNSIREKRHQLNSLYEQQNSQTQRNRYLASNIKFREKSDRIVVKMLHDALRYIKSAESKKAYELLDEAQRLAPDYYEVARVKAYFYQRSGDLHEAREQYELSLVLSPKTAQLHFWFGKFILQLEEDVDGAVEQFEKAFELDNKSLDVSLALARGYMFQHKFNEANNILIELSKTINVKDEQNYKIYLDTKIQIPYRIADEFASEGKLSEAIDSLIEMKEIFDSIPSHFKDLHTRKKLAKCSYIFTKLRKLHDPDSEAKIKMLKEWVDSESA